MLLSKFLFLESFCEEDLERCDCYEIILEVYWYYDRFL